MPKTATKIIILCFLLASCAAGRGALLDLSKENLKNFAVADELMKDFLKIWPQISGALEGARERLPVRLMSDKDKIDELIDAGNLTKKERAEIGIRFAFLTDEFAQRAYQQFAPQVLAVLRRVTTGI